MNFRPLRVPMKRCRRSKISTTSLSQCLHSYLIAGALDEDDRPHTSIVTAQHLARMRNSLAAVLNGYSDPRCQLRHGRF